MTSYTIDSYTLTFDQQHRLLFIADAVVKLTPTEYQLMLGFIDGGVAQDETLARRALLTEGPTNTMRANLEKHINNIRKKIRRYGLRIYRVHGYGYVLAGHANR